MIRLTIPFINNTVKKTMFKTVSSAKIWDKVLCVIFPQIITCAAVLTKYELIGNVYIIMAINYIKQKCNISYKPAIR